MVFNDSTVKIQTRVLSAIHLLRPSKSALSLISLFNSHPRTPVPNFQSSSLSKSTEPLVSAEFSDIKPTEPVMLKRSSQRLTKRAAGFKSTRPALNQPKPVLTQLLEQQGLLDSPISIHITSLVAVPCASDVSSFDTRIARRRSSSDFAYLESFLRTTTAGPFTPEYVVLNAAGKSASQFCVPHSGTAQPQSCPPLVTENCHRRAASHLSLEIVKSFEQDHRPSLLAHAVE